MAKLIGEYCRKHGLLKSETSKAVEIGCGSGKSTYYFFSENPNCYVTAIDNEPTMLEQAHACVTLLDNNKQITFLERDALSAMKQLESESVDIVFSVYAIHNMLCDYRAKLHKEIFRVLCSGGVFLNGDRYAVDDVFLQQRIIQDEAKRYIDVFTEHGRTDLLTEWILHLFSNQNPERIMLESEARSNYEASGFENIEILFREEIDALVKCEKPSTK